MDLQTKLCDHFRTWIWAYRNNELKDHQKQLDLNKRMIKTKFRDRNKDIHLTLNRSRTSITNSYTFPNATTDIINNKIIFGSSITDV